jgi:hypothetical protein
MMHREDGSEPIAVWNGRARRECVAGSAVAPHVWLVAG